MATVAAAASLAAADIAPPRPVITNTPRPPTTNTPPRPLVTDEKLDGGAKDFADAGTKLLDGGTKLFEVGPKAADGGVTPAPRPKPSKLPKVG